MVQVRRLRVRDFRTYAAADVPVGAGLTVLHGPNGAGKTNVLEALYFGCTARSCRTANEREVVRFDAPAARVEVDTTDGEGDRHTLAVGFAPGEPKRIRVDGAPVERLTDSPARPLVSVFLPDRLELVKGAPTGRRAHLDQLVAALWPSRAANRAQYSRAIAQRNALLSRVRSGRASPASLDAWDLELARWGIALRDDRAAAVERVGAMFPAIAGELGLNGAAELRYRPRSRAETAGELAAELAERRAGDLDRGFTQHGPHRDDLLFQRDGRDLKAFGSQGEQRLALLSLLLAERAVLAQERGAAPLMLLDDVMSELDADRRALLIARLDDGGQAVLTTTDLAHVPGGEAAGVVRLAVTPGVVSVEDAAGSSPPAEASSASPPAPTDPTMLSAAEAA
ncbi:MAG TPA: DNA replication and repair protein RecF [Baekduia sp.]|uniref:DNA replication/repair protein RecF n=1 Tax=Baekduia sp. TaxID=2600305 RepID=UPI002D7781A3|nr:DNA replication and repair protein RecF [Baekduia sp.]HET6508817.1 DNA replication and repair protein RecF [Baekduia sp.]